MKGWHRTCFVSMSAEERGGTIQQMHKDQRAERSQSQRSLHSTWLELIILILNIYSYFNDISHSSNAESAFLKVTVSIPVRLCERAFWNGTLLFEINIFINESLHPEISLHELIVNLNKWTLGPLVSMDESNSKWCRTHLVCQLTRVFLFNIRSPSIWWRRCRIRTYLLQLEVRWAGGNLFLKDIRGMKCEPTHMSTGLVSAAQWVSRT